MSAPPSRRRLSVRVRRKLVVWSRCLESVDGNHKRAMDLYALWLRTERLSGSELMKLDAAVARALS